MLSLTLHPQCWLHRVPAGWKLVALAGTTVLVLPMTEPVAGLAAAAAVVALYATCGTGALRRLWLVRPLLPLLAILLLAQGLLDGWGVAVAVCTRILAMVWLASLVTMTTRMDDMLDAVSTLLAPLRLVGLAPRTIALAVALVVRFTPVLLAEWNALSEAWRARSGRRPGTRLVAPFALRMLDLAEHVGEALAARYAPAQDRREPPPSPGARDADRSPATGDAPWTPAATSRGSPSSPPSSPPSG